MMEEIIYSLGLSCRKEREQIRTSYVLGTLKIDIDQFPGIPCFAEIEGRREHIKHFLSRLDFSLKDTTNLPTAKILEKYGQFKHTIKFK